MVNNLAPAPTGRLPVTRPLAAASFVLPVLLAAVIGLAIAVDLRLTVALCVGAIAAAAMLIRLEWAALLVVGAAVFEDYLAVASPWAAKGLALVLVGSWVVRRGWRRLHEGTRSPVLTVALAFFVAILLATVVHNNGSVGMAVVGRYVGFLAVLAVLVDTMRGGLAPSRVARVYVASCAVAAVCGILTFAFALDRRVGGPVADPNDFAFFLVAAIPLAVALRVGARRPWAYDLAAGLMLVAALGTLSRGALVGLATMVVVATVTRVVSLRAVAIGAVGAATLVAVAVGAFPDLVDVSLHQKSVVADQNVSERIGLWRAAGEMTLENPVIGSRPGLFQPVPPGLPRPVARRRDPQAGRRAQHLSRDLRRAGPGRSRGLAGPARDRGDLGLGPVVARPPPCRGRGLRGRVRCRRQCRVRHRAVLPAALAPRCPRWGAAAPAALDRHAPAATAQPVGRTCASSSS